MAFLEKGMKDSRFRRHEEDFLKVFYVENSKGTTMKKMAKKAGVGRSTIYLHHHAVREVIPDYERYMLLQFKELIQKKIRRKNVQIKMLYLEMLVFMMRNKRIFEMFLKFDKREILIKMIEKMRTKIVSYAKFPKNYEKMFRVYEGEVVELIFDWGRKGFSEKELMRVLSDIMYLTDTARARLMPICD